MSLRLGLAAEDRALDFLMGHGFTLVARNYRCSRGEIDLIMQQGQGLVFVEVRKRTNGHFGTALESVNRQKQERLLYSAEHYLQANPKLRNWPRRFDIVAIEGEAGKINWIKNAFGE